ncbi:MAG: bifunctional diguanylate cyclase/phosphodiesterase [Hyphomonadaceae bacterium]|nr:bifunctional diguanylate cyclase/phosphodiesterase [Hyphomonadaceae bacterium]
MPAKSVKRRGMKLGLAGRVALIACGTAVAATLMQWVVTPVLLRSSFDRARLQYSHDAAQQLALLAGDDMQTGEGTDLEKLVERMGNPLPGGGAAIVGVDGKIIAANKSGAELVRSLGPDRAHLREVAFSRGETRIGIAPIKQDSSVIGYAVLAMEPRSLISTWISIIIANALVFVLMLGVCSFFLLPLARKAMRPVTDLEQRIRQRDARDKSRLADSSDDKVLKPLLAAIDGVHDRSEAAMRRALALAYADPVTRLPNRLRFISKLEALVDKGQGEPVHLAICDVDNFRKINVTLGPRLADAVLATIAERLRAAASQTQGGSFFIGRIGADQFGVIAPGIDHATLKSFLSSAEQAVCDAYTLDGQSVRITMSFGAACAPGDASTATDLLKQAEIALKEAKRAPGVRYAFFDQRLHDKARAQQKLEAEVREAIERNEFVAVFQPKVRLETGELVGAEALARWRRPDGAVVSPGVFVPIAEELGLIGRLGRSVMRDACIAAAGWNKKGIVASIAVNVSPYQFDEPDFIQSVYQVLDESGLDPELLELEITESAAVSDPDRVARIMWPLRNRGVRLAIDDFGTGHSNFASITRLPFDVFKIDQQFVRALNTDPHAPAIVEMILAMAEALGQETVAEGVETKEQADFLLRRACTIGQGYYYSPPLPAEEFDLFVRSWRPRPANRFAA